MKLKKIKIKNIIEGLAKLYIQLTKEHIEDAVHQALYLYLAQEKKYFDSISNPEAWIWKTAKHILLKQKKQSNINYIFEEQGIDSYKYGLYEEIDFYHFDTVVEEKLAQALEMLKDEDAISIILFYCEERNINEIAKYLNCSVSAAYKRIERALGKLRMIMNVPPPKK